MIQGNRRKPRNDRAINAARQKTQEIGQANRADILKMLQASKAGLHKEAIASRLGVSSSCAERHLRLLVQEQLIVWQKDVLNGNRRHYQAKEEG